jgi:uncharacterized membrane protein YbhN (UPF0104 family)
VRIVVFVTVLLTLISLVVVSQSSIQNRILKYFGIVRKNRYLKLLICNSILLGPTLMVGYLVLPLQLYLQSKFLQINKAQTIKLGIYEVVLCLIGLVMVASIMLTFNMGDLGAFLDHKSLTTLGLALLMVLPLGILLKRFTKRFSFVKLQKYIETYSRVNSTTTQSSTEGIKPDWKRSFILLPILPLASFTFLSDSILFLVISEVDISLQNLMKTFFVFLCSYIIGVVSQIPGGIGVRELSSGLMLAEIGLGVAAEIVALVGLIRISKVLAGGLLSLVGLIVLRWQSV